MSLPASLIPESESRSSLFEKLPADLRRRLDQAIIDRDPASYRDLLVPAQIERNSRSLQA